MKKAIAISFVVFSLCVLMTSCGNSDDNSSTTTKVTTSQTTTQTTVVTEPLEPDEVIPDAVQTPRVDGNRLSFSIKNIYSQLEYYTVEI